MFKTSWVRDVIAQFFFLISRQNLHSLNFWPLIYVFCSLATHLSKSLSLSSYLYNVIKQAAIRCPLNLVQGGQTHSSQLIFIGPVLQPPDHLGGSLLDSFKFISIFRVCVGSQLGVDQMGSNNIQKIIVSLDLLAVLPLVEQSMLLAFIAARYLAAGWPMLFAGIGQITK